MSAPIHFGPFQLDPDQGQLLRGDLPVHLPPRALAVLELLVADAARVVSKEELLAAVWGDATVGDEALTQAVSLIRQALGDDPRSPQFIETVARRGYRFVGNGRGAGRATAVGGGRHHNWWPVISVASLVGAGLIWWTSQMGAPGPGEPHSLVKFEIVPPNGVELVTDFADGSIAISADGSMVAFPGETSVGRQIFIRYLTRSVPVPVEGTEGGVWPFFSPDGVWLGFARGSRFYRVPVSGGAPIEIAEGAQLGGVWMPDGRLVLRREGSLWLYSPNGAELGLLASSRAGWSSFAFPHRSPDGAVVVAPRADMLSDAIDEARISVFSVDDGIEIPLALRGVAPLVTLSGHLVYLHGGALYAAPVDDGQHSVVGPAVRVVEGVAMSRRRGTRTFDVSDTGTLVYRTGGASEGGRVRRVSRDGEGELLPLPENLSFGQASYSPDGRRLALVSDWTRADIWLFDLEREQLTRLTDRDHNHHPVWSPDGGELYFSGYRDYERRVLTRLRPGNGDQTDLLEVANLHSLGSISPDGRWLLYALHLSEGEIGFDLWVASTDGSVEPRPFLDSPYRERLATFSPDGRWVAYSSNETGRDEVYLASFPDAEERRMVSVDGGWDPVWSEATDELFFVQGERLMVVAITTDPLTIGRPQLLFEVPFVGRGHTYDVSPDGQEFMVAVLDPPVPPQLHVVLDWLPELERLAPHPR